jgi:hypothetical protein
MMEEHERGAILVATIIDAFLSIYRARVADLQRIATNGTGILPQGELHPDLVNRFAKEAAKAAAQVCRICIRALDYCPPVDITFGDYLRALITADYDVVPDDDLGYRVALIEAFRRRGILPEDVRTISEDSLLWDNGKLILDMDERRGGEVSLEHGVACISNWLREHMGDVAQAKTRKDHYIQTQRLSARLHHFVANEFDEVNARSLHRLTGLQLSAASPSASGADFQVHSLRPAMRVGPDGDVRCQIVISLLQRRRLPLDPNPKTNQGRWFTFRGGCTLILDLETMELRYAIKKSITDKNRIARQRRYLSGEWGMPERSVYFDGRFGDEDEPFALLHSTL